MPKKLFRKSIYPILVLPVVLVALSLLTNNNSNTPPLSKHTESPSLLAQSRQARSHKPKVPKKTSYLTLAVTGVALGSFAYLATQYGPQWVSALSSTSEEVSDSSETTPKSMLSPDAQSQPTDLSSLHNAKAAPPRTPPRVSTKEQDSTAGLDISESSDEAEETAPEQPKPTAPSRKLLGTGEPQGISIGNKSPTKPCHCLVLQWERKEATEEHASTRYVCTLPPQSALWVSSGAGDARTLAPHGPDGDIKKCCCGEYICYQEGGVWHVKKVKDGAGKPIEDLQGTYDTKAGRWNLEAIDIDCLLPAPPVESASYCDSDDEKAQTFTTRQGSESSAEEESSDEDIMRTFSVLSGIPKTSSPASDATAIVNSSSATTPPIGRCICAWRQWETMKQTAEETESGRKTGVSSTLYECTIPKPAEDVSEWYHGRYLCTKPADKSFWVFYKYTEDKYIGTYNAEKERWELITDRNEQYIILGLPAPPVEAMQVAYMGSIVAQDKRASHLLSLQEEDSSIPIEIPPLSLSPYPSLSLRNDGSSGKSPIVSVIAPSPSVTPTEETVLPITLAKAPISTPTCDSQCVYGVIGPLKIEEETVPSPPAYPPPVIYIEPTPEYYPRRASLPTFPSYAPYQPLLQTPPPEEPTPPPYHLTRIETQGQKGRARTRSLSSISMPHTRSQSAYMAEEIIERTKRSSHHDLGSHVTTPASLAMAIDKGDTPSSATATKKKKKRRKKKRRKKKRTPKKEVSEKRVLPQRHAASEYDLWKGYASDKSVGTPASTTSLDSYGSGYRSGYYSLPAGAYYPAEYYTGHYPDPSSISSDWRYAPRGYGSGYFSGPEYRSGSRYGGHFVPSDLVPRRSPSLPHAMAGYYSDAPPPPRSRTMSLIDYRPSKARVTRASRRKPAPPKKRRSASVSVIESGRSLSRKQGKMWEGRVTIDRGSVHPRHRKKLSKATEEKKPA